MRLPRQDRRWYAPNLEARTVAGVTVSVPVNGWECSIDNGQTWVPSRDSGDGAPGWLIAGPAFPGPGDDANGITADFTIATNSQAVIRLRDTPETVSVKGAAIILS